MPHDPKPAAADRAGFDAATRAAGLELPAENLDVLFIGYQDLQRMRALVRGARTPAAEPANVFDVRTVTRRAGR